jgi:hypothetical protein
MVFTPSAYGPSVEAILNGAPLCALGPGKPKAARRTALEALAPETIVEPHALVDRTMAQCCLAGLWLRHDFLDESHAISQQIKTPSGSYWHAIMHRREPDFGNSKYWFHRVGPHPVFEPLCAAARELAIDSRAGKATGALARQSQWDPFEFVDLCQRATDESSPLYSLCQQIQQREWELLFAYCHDRAAGR